MCVGRASERVRFLGVEATYGCTLVHRNLEFFAVQVLDLAVQQEILTRGQEESILKLARGEREQPAGAQWEGLGSLAPFDRCCGLNQHVYLFMAATPKPGCQQPAQKIVRTELRVCQ